MTASFLSAQAVIQTYSGNKPTPNLWMKEDWLFRWPFQSQPVTRVVILL
jgi:hypothetical protein